VPLCLCVCVSMCVHVFVLALTPCCKSKLLLLAARGEMTSTLMFLVLCNSFMQKSLWMHTWLRDNRHTCVQSCCTCIREDSCVDANQSTSAVQQRAPTATCVRRVFMCVCLCVCMWMCVCVYVCAYVDVFCHLFCVSFPLLPASAHICVDA